MTKDKFSGRWGFVFATLGMAIGAGNLWRFPRLAGQYGGSFILLWLLFLLIWSIPILLCEFAIGKRFRKSVISSFGLFAGKKYVWMGVFITLCTLGITFYYSTVTAWGLRYIGFFFTTIFQDSQGVWESGFFENYWKGVSNYSLATILAQVVSIVLACFILYRGIQKGLEKANRILIPFLFIMLIIIAISSLTRENGMEGLKYMFAVDLSHFQNPKVWIEALSQSAWSTGAGWGLMITLSSYTRKNEDVTLNTFIGGFGNNFASILAGVAILPSVFALSENSSMAIEYLGKGNQGLTFNIIPMLFLSIKGGSFLGLTFFLAFFVAAFSSLLALTELMLKTLMDLGFNRHRAALTTAGACILFGFPSAYSLDFFSNQDWVWGIGLVVSGLFIVFAVVKEGAISFKMKWIDPGSDFKLNNLFFKIALLLNIPSAIILIYWWLSRGYSQHPWFDRNNNWNLFDVYSNATVITQWGILILAGLLLNNVIYRVFVSNKYSDS